MADWLYPARYSRLAIPGHIKPIGYSREPAKLGGHVRIFMSGPRNIYERFMSEKKTARLAHNFFYEQVASKIVRTFYEHIMSKVRASESEKKEG